MAILLYLDLCEEHFRKLKKQVIWNSLCYQHDLGVTNSPCECIDGDVNEGTEFTNPYNEGNECTNPYIMHAVLSLDDGSPEIELSPTCTYTAS